jgi:hypothetical protein
MISKKSRPGRVLERFKAGCSVLVGLVLAHHLPFVNAQVAEETFCGRGPAPGGVEFEEYLSRRQAQQASLGYVRVCEGDISRIDGHRHLEMFAHARHRLVFRPLDMSESIFSRFEAIAAIPSHSSNAEAFALKRYFRLEDGRVVSTLEWHMQKAGGGVRWHGNPVTVDVLGYQARLTRIQAPSGDSYATLSWVVDGVYLEIGVRAPIPSGADDRFVKRLAEALTAAMLKAPR